MKPTAPLPLYGHTTDGGAQYLCSAPVPGTNEGGFEHSRLIVRLDGPPSYQDRAYTRLVSTLREALDAIVAEWPDDGQMQTLAPDTYRLCERIKGLLEECGE